MRFAQVHLHEDAVIVGDLNFAAYDPAYICLVAGGLVFSPVFITWMIRVLAAATFDEAYARTHGVATRALSYALMALVAPNVVAAFNAAGAVRVVALMIVTGATALLFARSVIQMCHASLAITAASATIGFWIAYVTNAATSTTMVAVQGAIIVLARRAVQVAKNGRLRYSALD